MSEETYEGIPRKLIPWSPKIDYEKCVTCGKCVEFCHKEAFEFQEKDGKKITVAKNPSTCVVFCRGCEDICPTGAISHPSEEKTKQIIEKLRRNKA
ncbi:MAG: ferredoxin family protein [Candidatus Bathyarchaeia archaeon]|jgi:NAD-dependent dihydropyrimidine dehydrogenase PreA subunit